jgi:hypothetical protein
MQKRINPDRPAQLLALYNGGLSLHKIARMEGCTVEWVRQLIMRTGEYKPRLRGNQNSIAREKRPVGRPPKTLQNLQECEPAVSQPEAAGEA